MAWSRAEEEERAPRLIVAAPVDPGTADIAVWGLRLGNAGADALLLQPVGGDNPRWTRDLVADLRRRIPSTLLMLVEDAPALAAATGTGILLAEHGISTAEARRVIGPAGLIGRIVATEAAAAAALGADFLVVGPASAGSGVVRRIVETAWAPVVVDLGETGRVAGVSVDSAIAAGAEGVLLRPPTGIESSDVIDAVSAVRKRLPPKPFPPPETEPTILVDGSALRLVPDTAITDLLADLDRVRAAAIAVNGVQVPRGRWDDALLAPGDVVEITGG